MRSCVHGGDDPSLCEVGFAAAFYGISILAKQDYKLRLANGMANPSVVSVVCDVRALYSGGLTFWGYFAPYCSQLRQLTHQKSRRSSKGITLSELISLIGVWLCDSSKVP